MKYFTPGMPLETAKADYRKFAKTMHPDVGGDEEEFKILANEYAMICSGVFVDVSKTMESMAARNKVFADLILSTLLEIYPRIPIQVWVGLRDIDFDFMEVVPFKKILHVVEIVNTFNPQVVINYSFVRPELKKRISMYERNHTLYINMARSDPAPISVEGKVIYKGRRYTVVQDKKYSQCTDSVAKCSYIMKRSNKLSILELFKLESKDSLSK